MTTIATLTMNPTIDVALEVDRVVPTHKLRGRNELHAPGGGGICVARVFVRLGGKAHCFYLSGGPMGVALDGLLDRHQLVRSKVAIEGETRLSTSVFDRESGKEYRFVAEGPTVSRAEWEACLASLQAAQCDYLVASGSLPKGVPDDFYGRVGAIASERGARFVLDTSGPPLAAGLAAGGVFLVKPSIGELRALSGEPLTTGESIAAAARDIAARGQAEYVAVTMGRDGAMLASSKGVLSLPAVPVPTASAVGAGDSFLAAMIHAFALDLAPEEALRWGIAAGAAAVLTPGSGLARAADIERLHAGLAG